MKISHNSDLKILRAVGVFILLLYVAKVFSNPHLQMINGPSLFTHCISLLMMYLCFSWTWDMQLSAGKIESISGPAGMKKTKVIKGLQSVELGTDVIEAQGKGDSFMLNLTIKASSRLKPVAMLSGLKHEQGERLSEQAKKISQALGGLPINTSKHFEELYKFIYKKDFTL